MGPGVRSPPAPNPRQPQLGQTGSLSPDSADAACGQRPGHDLRALLHEAPHGEPEAVAQRVLILQDVGTCPQARVRVIPLVGAQPVERHGEWGEKGEEQRKERATVIRRDGGTKTEGKRDRDGQRETHTHTEKQRQCGQKGRGDRKNGKGRGPERTTEQKSEPPEGNTETGPEREKGGCRESKAPSGGLGWSRQMTERSGMETPARASSPPSPSQAAGSGLTWRPGTGRS